MTGAKRESKGQFWQRVQQEGRLAQAQAVEADLLLQRLSRRHVQKVLVSRFQPADGTLTRAWPTPDSWKCGRRYARRPVSADEQYEDDLHWAWNNLGRVKPENAPDARKRLLLSLAEQKPTEFHRKYQRALPSITSRQEGQEKERRNRWAQLEWERQRPQREEQERKQREAKRKRLWRLKKRQQKQAEEQKKRQQREAEDRAQQEQRRQQAEKEKRTAETLEVLRERRTKIENLEEEVTGEGGLVGRAKADYPVAAWSDNPEEAIMASPEAVAWQKELDVAKIAAQKNARQLAEKELAKQIKEAEKRRQREWEAERDRRLKQEKIEHEKTLALIAEADRQDGIRSARAIRQMQAAQERHWERTGERRPLSSF